MRTLIIGILFVGVLSSTFCGPVSQSVGPHKENQTARLEITTASLPTGIMGSYYSARLTAAGGVMPYHWSAIEGSLPPGLTIDDWSGDLRGHASGFVKHPLVVRVTDSTPGRNQEWIDVFHLEIAPDRLTILTEVLPPAVTGKPYTVKMEAAGGSEPYTWSILEGSLPSGLDLEPNSGIIQGIPSQPGTSVFIVQVTDSSNPPVSVAYRFTF